MHPSATQKHFFYAELAKLVESGFGIREAARILTDTGLTGSQKKLLDLMEAGLANGKSITDSFASDPSLVSSLELGIIGAGERGGRLGQAFQHLSAYFQLLATTRAELVKSMIYPLVLLHLGIILGGVTGGVLEGGSAKSILTAIIVRLLIAYAAGFLIWLVGRALWRKAPTHGRIDASLNRIPLLGRARRLLAMARFTRVYHTCLLAGLSMRETVGNASLAAQSGRISEAGTAMLVALDRGDRLGPVFVSSGAFPEAFARSYSTAEESGTLDRDLARWSELFQQDALAAARRASAIIPKVFYALVAGYVAWKIIGFYLGYLDSFDHLGE